MLIALLSVLLGCAIALPGIEPAYGRQGALEEFPTANPGGPGGVPLRLTAGPDREMWATVSGGRIVRYALNGTITGEFSAAVGTGPQTPEVSHPEGIAAGPDGSVWFTDVGTSADGHAFVGAISSSDTVTEYRLPTAGYLPISIVEGAEGNMWFTERPSLAEQSGAIGRITPTGEITEFKVPVEESLDEPKLSRPYAIALSPDGSLWFTDDGTGYVGFRGLVGRVTPQGEFSERPNPTDWGFPGGIARGADGNMWYAENEGNVIRVTPQWEMKRYPVITTSGGAGGVALGPDGDIWSAEGERANAIARLAPDGTVSEFSPVAPAGDYPVEVAFDADGNLWFGAHQGRAIGRWTTPRVPATEAPPELLGHAIQGQTLSSSTGRWAHEPETFAYQWESCDATGESCVPLAGQNGAEHYVSADDIGLTLRVDVTALALGGRASASSATSAVVVPAPPQPPPPVTTTPTISAPTSLATVPAYMTWRFAWSRRYTLVRSLVLHSVPRGAAVELQCRGVGCPFARRALTPAAPAASCHARRCAALAPPLRHGEASLAGLFAARRLRVGARISVLVSEPGFVGKDFTFTARANRPPLRAIQCLGERSGKGDAGC